MFADDLNIFKLFDQHTHPDTIFATLTTIQSDIHLWGSTNRVTFEPTKEYINILHPQKGIGDNFHLLGCIFDVFLKMDAAVDAILKRARRKYKSLLRTRIFYSDSDMILQYKSHILPILEAHSGAIFHATNSVLKPLDDLQSNFLTAIGMDEKKTLLLLII